MISEQRVKEIILEELQSHYEKEVDKNNDGDIGFDEFVSTFDANKDGIVNSQEFENQLRMICNNQHIVKPLLNKRVQSHQSVPCRNTYDKATQYLAHNIDNVYSKSYEDVNMECGAECPVSVMSAILDVMRSLEEMDCE